MGLLGCAMLCCHDGAGTLPAGEWTHPQRYRLELTVAAAQGDAVPGTVGVGPGIGPALRELGAAGSLDLASLRVVEIDEAGRVSNDRVVFQFDPMVDSAGRDELFLQLDGAAGGSGARRFLLYFDTEDSFEPEIFEPLVDVVEGLDDRGHESLRVDTRRGSWVFHSRGGGFASLFDVSGNDWIGWNPEPGAVGSYRGIPNLVYPEGYFHPGRDDCESRVTDRGVLRVRIESTCDRGHWETRWEIFPGYSRLTVIRAEHPYWFLYEGTPGGSLETDGDFVLLSTGRKLGASERFDDDLPGHEWLAFGDEQLDRLLVLAHHAGDAHPDAYYAMEESMTVFGFGRRKVKSFLTEVPAQFTVAFHEGVEFDGVRGFIETLLQTSRVRLGPVETRADSPAGS